MPQIIPNYPYLVAQKLAPMLLPTLHTPSPTVQRSLRTYTANGHSFRMVAIPKGRFLLGGKHEITFAQGYELGQYPVKQALWEAVMGEPWPHLWFQGKDRPMEDVSWDDIMGAEEGIKKGNTPDGFLHRLNALPEIAALNAQDGCQFALPTEAQWEHAARGGRYGAAFRGEYAGSNHLPDVGWYNVNSQIETQPVGSKQPNALGLYDMSGNVWEWCEDVWHDNYEAAPKDGAARADGEDKSIRVVRGGSWRYFDVNSRVAFRIWLEADSRGNDLGFRLSRYRVML